tara:strand:+ start:286 stop:849 length:564 start_codon:yes stop_codon:yes gene_type:complete
MSDQLVDIIIYLFIIYSAIIGFKRGLFSVLVGIFGIYGATFLAWLFQFKAQIYAIKYLGLPVNLNPVITFVVIWLLFYFGASILAKLLTSIFKLSGVNFLLRLIGLVLNSTKAVLIIIVVLTFITNINKNLFQGTPTTDFFIQFGLKAMGIYNNSLNENKLDLKKAPEIIQDSFIINDDFRYNLLER